MSLASLSLSQDRRSWRAGTSFVGGLAIVASLLGASGHNAIPATAAPVHAANADAKITPALEQKFMQSEGPLQDFWVSFATSADTKGARTIEDWAERGGHVVDRLRQTAKDAQGNVTALLDATGVDYTAYWITNAIRINDGDYALAQQLAAQPETERVFAPVTYERPEPVKEKVTSSGMGPQAAGVVEWGIQNVKADQVWQQYGVRGDGIVVANIDTGVQFDHPAVINAYRGYNGDGTFNNDHNWFDATGDGSSVPVDSNGHGTHTMGTMVGDDGAANQIGVAPGATWIAANGCCPTDQALIDSAQWMLAPTRVDGTDPDPAMRPHIVNNSWGSVNPSTDPFMEDIQQAWADAGIFGMWANGNSGPQCNTSGSPGSRTLNYSAGAYDSANKIAEFSARGPGQDGEVKPNISAPGAGVRSSWPGNQYVVASGTSMAAPHVAGAVALLWSAAPGLIGDIAATRQLLDDTAIDTPDDQCGGSADDNSVYGEGRLDALALVQATDQGERGTITGTVTHDETGDPVRCATIRLTAGGIKRSTRTGDDGAYSTSVPVGDYQATVSAFGYRTTTVAISVTAGATTVTDIRLPGADGFDISGTVVDARTGHGIPGTTITIAGSRFAATTTDAGKFAVPNVPGPARYVVTIDPPGRCAETQRRSVFVDGEITLPTIKMVRNLDRPGGIGDEAGNGLPYGYSCVVQPSEWTSGDTPIELPTDDRVVDVGLPFAFTYFGEQYHHLYADHHRGGVVFRILDNGQPASAELGVLRRLGGYALPDEAQSMWTRTAGTKPNRTFTVEWRNFLLDALKPERVSFEVTLHEDGDIVYAYKDLDPTNPTELGDRGDVGMTDHSPNGDGRSRTQLWYSNWEPVLSDARQIRFELPPNGFVTGQVVDKVTRKPVPDATVDLFNQHGTRLVRKTTNEDGTYRLQLMTGQPYTIGVLKPSGYDTPPRVQVELAEDREVRQLTTTLHGGRIELSDDAVELQPGQTGAVRLTNTGDRQLTWWATTHPDDSTPVPGSMLDATDTSPFAPQGVTEARGAWWVGGAPALFKWGLVEMNDGHRTGAEIDLESVAQQLGMPPAELSPREMEWIPHRDWLCLLPSFRTATMIVCIDPETSSVLRKIPTGLGDGLRSTGLAYDAARDLFYVSSIYGGSGFQVEVRTLAGPGHPEPGAVQNTCLFPYLGLGLTYNPTSRTLWAMTQVHGAANVMRQIEPRSCTHLSRFSIGYSRPGLLNGGVGLDSLGNFLIPHGGSALYPSSISTMQTADPVARPLPWLHVSTTSGSLKPHSHQKLQITVDWANVPAGVTGAKLVFRGNGGAQPLVTIPITLKR